MMQDLFVQLSKYTVLVGRQVILETKNLASTKEG